MSTALSEKREGRITGTMATQILGVSPYGTPLSAWTRLTGRLAAADISGESYIKAGNYLEPAVAEWWSDETGLKLSKESPGTLIDSEFDWLAGTPDRLILPSEGRGEGVWEGKTASYHKREDWSENEVPLAFQVQLQIYLRVTGLSWGSFGALIGGNDFRWKHVERDDRFIAATIEFLLDWRERFIVKDTPPPPSATERDTRILRALHPKDSGASIDLSPASTASLLRMREITAAIKALEEEKVALTNPVMVELGDASYGHGDGIGCSWKYQVSEYQPQPARTVETRVFRVTKK
jgi:putative phage-type endonuclease